MKYISALLLSLVISSNSYSQNEKQGGKTSSAAFPQPCVLIPAAGDTRVGWLNSGWLNLMNTYFMPLGMTPMALVDNGGVNRILNLSTVGGLPAHFAGPWSLTGMSWSPITTPGYNYYFCGTLTGSLGLNHYLIAANLPTLSSDFNVTNAYVVNCSFAPPSGGWKIKHIEYVYTVGAIYALVSNGIGTYLIRFGITGGTATAVNFWPTTVFHSMDYVGGSYIDLINYSVGLIIYFDIGSATISSAVAIPSGSVAGVGHLNTFMHAATPGTFYYTGTAVYNFATSTPFPSNFYRLSGMSSITSVGPFIGVILPDGSRW